MVFQKNSPYQVWHIRRNSDYRFQMGHPWIYSNELTESPKGIHPGDPIELRNYSGKFLAWGYGNPYSLIAFRAVSRIQNESDFFSAQSLMRKFRAALNLRVRVGLSDYSHRLFFGEADGIPGLIIDRYRIGKLNQVFVIQAHTAGVDCIIPRIIESLETLTQERKEIAWENTSIIIRNDIQVRKLEGLEVKPPKVISQNSDLDLQNCRILVKSVLNDEPIYFETDLVDGQKTGFFLDQYGNIQQAFLRLKHFASKKVRILDLCCYVGQWSAQLAKVFKSLGISVEVVAFDASEKSLKFAQKNMSSLGVSCELLRGDVRKDLSNLEARSYDLVISDPPAFIKNRKDISVGTHAYLQLATDVLRLVKLDGAVIFCSCSALLSEESFVQILSKASRRNEIEVRWVGKGMQSPDHPILLEFPEGQYLKSWIGLLA